MAAFAGQLVKIVVNRGAGFCLEEHLQSRKSEEESSKGSGFVHSILFLCLMFHGVSRCSGTL